MVAAPPPPLVALAALTAVAVVGAGAVVAQRPSGGPAAVVDHRRPAAAAPRTAVEPPARPAGPRAAVGSGPATAGDGVRRRRPLLEWPLAPRPAVVATFAPGPFRWSAGHRGIDLAGTEGSAVLAAGPGVVSFAGQVGGVPVVSVRHPGGLRTTYQPVSVSGAGGATAGQGVGVGQRLGTLVATGSHCAPRACLHLGAVVGERYVDPLPLLLGLPYPVLLPTGALAARAADPRVRPPRPAWP
jgi:murein DD-endopeptidase MepM/ murein hydrolase activator NlpD